MYDAPAHGQALRRQRHPDNPVLRPEPGTWREVQTANPDLLRLGDTWYLYFRGQQGGHDRIGFATMPVDRFDGFPYTPASPGPVLPAGAAGQWDEGAVWFATIERIGGRYWMWYEGYGGGDARNTEYGTYLDPARLQIGLATLDAPFCFVPPRPRPAAGALAHGEVSG